MSSPRDLPDDGTADLGAAPAVMPGTEAPSEMGSQQVLAAAAGGELRQSSLYKDAWRSLRRNPLFLGPAAVLLVLTTMAVAPQLFTGADPRDCDLSRNPLVTGGDRMGGWFGHDIQGCDYYANVVHGARVSMAIGLLVVLGALLLGVVLGALCGYYGGWVDSLVSRATDVWYGLPLILGAILLLNAFEERGLFQVALCLAALSWMTPLRLVRSTVIGARDADYVQAARALGAPTWRVITRHVLPNAVAPVMVYSTIAFGTIIAAEATLSFLGVGLRQPSISWGLQIDAAQEYLRSAPHLLLWPSLFLSVTVLSFIMLGDALRDALDPKLR